MIFPICHPILLNPILLISDHYSLAIGINNNNVINKCDTGNVALYNTKILFNFHHLNKQIFSFNWYNFLLDYDFDILVDKLNDKFIYFFH